MGPYMRKSGPWKYEMNEKHLMILSSIMFIIGSSAMLLVSLADPETTTIEQLDRDRVGDFIKIEGVVDSPRIINGNTFLIIRQGSDTIDSVIFRHEEKLYTGQEITAKAEVALYKGKLELIIESFEIS